MLSLTEEEWAELQVVPAAQRLFDQIRRYKAELADEMTQGLLLNTDPHTVASNYAFRVGIISALTDIVDYKPPKEGVEDEQ